MLETFYYVGDMFSVSDGTSEVVSVGISCTWKKFRYLVGVLVGKQGLYLRHRGKIYQ